jgi:hypothetical protein
MALFLFRKFSNINVKVHGSGIHLNLNDKKYFISLAPNGKIEIIYKTLKDFENVRVESLEGIKIGQTTYFSELQGSSFYIKVGDQSFKVIQSDFETPLGMHRFLFENESEGIEKYIFMHHYLSRIHKATLPGKRYSKEALASIIQDTCPSNTSNSLTSQEIHDRIMKNYSEIQEMKLKFEDLNKIADKSAKRTLWAGFVVTLAQMAYIASGTYYFYCWDIMEAQAYLITLGNTVFGLGMYTYYQLHPHQLSFYSRIYQKVLKNESNSCNFDLERFQNLKKELENLQGMLTLDSSLKKSN